MAKKRKSAAPKKAPATKPVKSGLVPISKIIESPENETLYRPVAAADPEIRYLAESIRKYGVLEPLVISADGYIISGHRRLVAARMAGLQEVPCLIISIRREDDLNKFVAILREHNRQRDKTDQEKLNEEIASIDPEQAWEELDFQRMLRVSSLRPTGVMQIRGESTRATISAAKGPLLMAASQIIADRQEFWPLDIRQIHYALLNDPPLKHAGKPHSSYANDLRSYKSLCDLLTRSRLHGWTPWPAIGDATRPVFLANAHATSRSYLHSQLDGLLGTYRRDLLQSQPNHVELLAEKSTLSSILRPIANEYTLPLTIGRGCCMLSPRHEMAIRSANSGKVLVLLIISDFDPDGQEIAQSFARSLRDDFGIRAIYPIQVAITSEQVAEFDLPPNRLEAKQSSARYKKFVDQYGTDVFEVEALEPQDLQQIVREAIEGVLDMDAFCKERDAEKQDAAFLKAIRQRAVKAIGDFQDDESASPKGKWKKQTRNREHYLGREQIIRGRTLIEDLQL